MRLLWAVDMLIQTAALALGIVSLAVYQRPDWAAAMFALGTFGVAWDIRARLLDKGS